MESAELGMVEAEEAGEVPETARSLRQTLQASVWRLEGGLHDARKNKIQILQCL